MDDYKSAALIKEFELFVDDISNWYIRTNRRRFWKTEDQADKMVAYWTLFNALKVCVQTMAPITPFMTDYIWQKLIKKCDSTVAESVHLSDWPAELEGISDDGIIEQTALVREVIATAIFVLVILGVTHNDKHAGKAGIVIGLTLALIHMVCIPLTGTSVNPARSLAPAVLVGGDAFIQVWVFIVGPIVGALVAGYLYKYLKARSK